MGPSDGYGGCRAPGTRGGSLANNTKKALNLAFTREIDECLATLANYLWHCIADSHYN